MRQHAVRLAVLGLVALLVASGLAGAFSSWGLSPQAQIAFVIFLVAATLWISEAVPLFVTSFVILLMNLVWLTPALARAGAATPGATFLAPFFSDIILLFLGGFVLSATLRKFRLDELLARWMIARSGRTIPGLILTIMATTAFLSMWLSNTATAAMMLGLCLPMVARLPPGDGSRRALVLAVAFAANLGGLGTPVGSPPNAIAIAAMREHGFAPSFGLWMVIGVPGVVVMLLLAWLVLLRVHRGQAVSLAPDDTTITLAPRRTLVLITAVTLLTVAGWVTGAWHGYTAGTVAILPVLCFFGSRMLSLADLRGLSWDVLLIMGGGGSLGRAIETSGLADWLLGRLPLEDASLFALVAIFAAVAMTLSSLMSSTATANLVMPVVLGLQVEALAPIAVGVAFACNLAMPLPVSTPPNAMAFGSGQLTVRDMLRPGLLVMGAGLLLACTTGYWWWKLMGLF